MARKIFKGSITLSSEPVVVRCFRGSIIRKMVVRQTGVDKDGPVIGVVAYLEGDDAKIVEHRMFQWVPSGMVIPIGGEYVDTIMVGPDELHLFELIGAQIDLKDLAEREDRARRS